MRTPDPQQRESKRMALLDAASQCFAEAGFVATRTADICARAGMSAGNLFHYFASKHEVLLALVAREGAQIQQAMAPLAKAANPMAQLLAFPRSGLPIGLRPPLRRPGAGDLGPGPS